MIRFIPLMFFPLVLLPSSELLGQTSIHVVDDVRTIIDWDDMVDSIVDVDGLVWCAFDKGLGAHLILTHGKVYLKHVNLNSADLNGRLVRISGVLRKGRMQAAPKGAQGYSQPFDYFYLETLSISQIEKLEQDQLLPTKHDWIVTGASADSVARLIADRRLEAYTLSLADSKDGSTSHSYLAAERLVVVYRVLHDKITAVSIVNLNGFGKRDDEWVSIPAFKLPDVTRNAR